MNNLKVQILKVKQNLERFTTNIFLFLFQNKTFNNFFFIFKFLKLFEWHFATTLAIFLQFQFFFVSNFTQDIFHVFSLLQIKDVVKETIECFRMPLPLPSSSSSSLSLCIHADPTVVEEEKL